MRINIYIYIYLIQYSIFELGNPKGSPRRNLLKKFQIESLEGIPQKNPPKESPKRIPQSLEVTP